jgi:hypothetical protein
MFLHHLTGQEVMLFHRARFLGIKSLPTTANEINLVSFLMAFIPSSSLARPIELVGGTVYQWHGDNVGFAGKRGLVCDIQPPVRAHG